MRKFLWCSAAMMALGGAFWIGRASAEDKPQNRLFELRTYTAVDGKLDALNARFRDHTCKLFEKHGITNFGYWIPTDKPNTLIYLLAHKSQEAAKASC